MKNNIVLITAVALVLGGAGGFFGGLKYQQSKLPSFSGQAGRFTGNRTGSTNRAGFTPINGQVIASDTNSITVSMQDGSSKIVLVTTGTQINKAATGTIADLKNGDKVAVFGTTNSDGSVTAQNIQINPIQRQNPSINPQTTPQP